MNTFAFPPSRGATGQALRVFPGQQDLKGSRHRPPKVVIAGRANSGVTPPTGLTRIFTPNDAIEDFGQGSQVDDMVKRWFEGGNPVETYTLAVDVTGGTPAAASGTITPSITGPGGEVTFSQRYQVKASNRGSDYFYAVPGDTVATIIDKMVIAVAAVVDLPITLSDDTTSASVDLKYLGELGNLMHIEVDTPSNGEVAFSIVQPTGGTGLADVETALAKLGSTTWYTHLVTDLEYTNGTQLDLVQVWGQGTDGFGGRYYPTVHHPCVAITGTSESNVSTVVAITSARSDDKTNVIIPNPASNDMPYTIAAEVGREIAKMDNLDPALDYCSLQTPLNGLTAGPDASVWTDLNGMLEAAFDGGCSTLRVEDGKVYINDIITCYHPTVDPAAVFRYVNDIAKIGSAMNEIDIVMKVVKGRPMVPDAQPTKNPHALKPFVVKGWIDSATDRLAGDAILSDPEGIKANTRVSIGTTNQRRVDIYYPIKPSGNANVVSIDMPISFYYGGE